VTQEQGFEMTVLRLLAFRPMQVNEVVISQPQQHIEKQALSVETQDKPLDIEPHQTVKSFAQAQDQTLIDTKIDDEAKIDAEVNIKSEAIEPDLSQQQLEPLKSDFAVMPQTLSVVSDPAFDAVEDELSQQIIEDHEPNSDDAFNEQFIEDTDSPVNTAQIQTVVTEPSLIIDQQANHNVQNEMSIDTSTPDLTLFGAELHSQSTNENSSTSTANQDVFFLAPEAQDQQLNIENAEAIQKQQPSENQVQVVKSENQLGSSDNAQTPQQILTLQSQDLEGDWTVDKWEYWFRNSSLSPAVQELAQHGLMMGMINGQSIFQTSPKYEKLLNQAQHDLEAALKQQWSQTIFTVQYGEVESITPYMMQKERKVRAFDRAAEMLQQEPVVKSLIDAFDGQIENIQLKS
jgi:DNA polymerase-3 subunit gamma/tau